MNNIIRYLLFGGIFVVVGMVAGFQLKPSTSTLTGGIKKFQEALYFIQDKYVEEPETEKLIDDAIKGMLEGLDPHSFYIPKTEMQQIEEQMSGGFEGIGVEFNILDDTIYVVTPLEGGPSAKLGIQSGDKIIEVEGEMVAGVSITNTKVMKMLKGDKGTIVRVGIMRSGVKNLIYYDIERDKIPLHSVNYAYMMNEDVGYIQITRFSETTYAEFSEKLQELKQAGMEKLILDLRGNPGGYLTMAHRIADEFLAGGKLIVSTEGRTADSRDKYRSSSRLAAFEEGALAILIDYGSASASEIVAGAVQDHDRGLILGVRSFGKGLVQIQKEFSDTSAMRIVVSKYYTPSGRCIQKPYHKSSKEYDAEIHERFESGEIFDESKIGEFPDSLRYQTASGRTVYGGGGILPDVFVPTDTTGGSEYFTNLQVADLFRKFSFDYYEQHPELKDQYKDAKDFLNRFQVTQSLIQEFTAYAESKEVAYDEAQYQRSKKYIDSRIKAYIGRRLFDYDGFYPVFHQIDKVIQKALEMMPTAEKLHETGKLD